MPSALTISRRPQPRATTPRPAAPRVHLAILHGRYIDAILLGEKTIESRLSRTRRAPFGLVRKGDVIFFKQSGGPVRARAIAKAVCTFSALTPEGVEALRDRYNAEIGGDDTYWHVKRDAKFATLIWLDDAMPFAGPRDALNVPSSSGHAWFVGM
jgi:ASC-1-like (ASCH) protein